MTTIEARCANCHNAFHHERNREATEAMFGDADGDEFICQRCAPPNQGEPQ